MCCPGEKPTMPKQKIVMPPNPTAIPNKHGITEKSELSMQEEQKLDAIVQEYTENADILATVDEPTPHAHELRERSNGRKSR